MLLFKNNLKNLKKKPIILEFFKYIIVIILKSYSFKLNQLQIKYDIMKLRRQSKLKTLFHLFKKNVPNVKIIFNINFYMLNKFNK